MGSAARVRGGNAAAPFVLTVHRGDGMALLAMNWRNGRRPPKDFVGFGIQYVPPGAAKPRNVTNRLTFSGVPDFRKRRPSIEAPIQKFRWVHFPPEQDMRGVFRYTITPVFMNADDSLRYGEAQEVDIELVAETVPGKLDVTFTRGFIASQAFVDRFAKDGDLTTLLPTSAKQGLTFTPSHPNATKALDWMGFEASRSVRALLDAARADPTCEVRVVAYDLSEGDIVDRLKLLGDRLRIIIDDSGDHGEHDSGETKAAKALALTAGADNVIRQHMGGLQHNKTIVVTGPNIQKALCGSTNYTWRGFYVQNNNVIVVNGERAVAPFATAFEQYWRGSPKAFKDSQPQSWTDLRIPGVKAHVTFSPHSDATAVLADIAADIRSATSNVLFSLAFLHQTPGSVREAIADAVADDEIFVAGISDMRTAALEVVAPDGSLSVVHTEVLVGNAPKPFSDEPEIKGKGTNLHHKFIVLDFGTPRARVYAGSFNFGKAADTSNGENLVRIEDPRVATSYGIEALRIYDHYRFRCRRAEAEAQDEEGDLALRRPPRGPDETPWFDDDYTVAQDILDRKLFA